MDLTLVVGGAPVLARELERTGQFARVVHVDSVAGMKALAQQGLLSGSREQVAFVLADDLPAGGDLGLEVMLRRLAGGSWRVLILGVTPHGPALSAKFPSLGFLPGPFTVNLTLGTLGSLCGLALPPVDGGSIDIDVRADAPAPGWATAPVVESSPSWTPAPDAAAAPAWTPATAEPAPAPAAAAPELEPSSRPAWGSSALDAQPTAPEAPAWTAAAPPAESPAATPVASEQPAATGWQTVAPAAAPAATPAWTPAPAEPAPAWAPENSWGGPAQRAGASSPDQRQRLGRVIVVTSPKGGVGKSGLTLNLGAYLGMRWASRGLNVCIVDMDFQKPDQGKYLGATSPTIMEILRDPTALSPDRIANFLVHKPECNLSVLLGPPTPQDASPMFVNASLYTQVLNALKPRYDVIIIDTPVAELHHEMFRKFALPNADYVIVPVAPNFATLQNADQWLRAINQPTYAGGHGIPAEKIGVVINRAEDGIDCPPEAIQRELFSWRFIGLIPESPVWKKAANAGQLVALMNFADINHAFSEILAAATGDESLRAPAPVSTVSSGRGGLLSRLFKRGRA